MDLPIDSEALLETDVLVVGGGPVGIFTALRLSQLGQSCTIVEQNSYTTIHPKMEYSSHRTMEIYRQIGLLDQVRSQGVPDTYGFTELFATGIGGRNLQVARIDRPCPADLRKSWAESNNGSHPLEPHMRQSQIIFEALLKQIIQKEPLVQSYWGYAFQSLVEVDDSVLSTIRDPSGKSLSIKSRYVIGCDGAGSKVRSSANIQSPKQSLPLSLAYVHFKSSDKKKLQNFGDFWHFTVITGTIIVAQDEIDTYTVHRLVPPGADFEIGDPEKFINESLGGIGGPADIKIDETIVSGKWQANLSIADSFRSDKGRIFLAGDAAHQLTPAGGHGMNSGIQDAYDLSWKLVAVLKGWGGDILLDSYNKERRPVAELNTAMVVKGVMEVVIPWTTKGQKLGFDNLIADTEKGLCARDELRNTILPGHWLHEQTGTVMGYRYNGSPIVVVDPSTPEPQTSITEYIPSTWPGARAPHVFLSDGKTSIFDTYGPDFNIVDFTTAGETSKAFISVAKSQGIPITAVHLPREAHCRQIWERDVVLVRPDGFVAWRCAPQGAEPTNEDHIKSILLSATGKPLVVEI